MNPSWTVEKLETPPAQVISNSCLPELFLEHPGSHATFDCRYTDHLYPSAYISEE